MCRVLLKFRKTFKSFPVKSVSIFFFLLFAQISSATSYEINVVGWNNSNPSFDTSIYVTTGDTLVFTNHTVDTSNFRIFVNYVSIDTVTNIPIGSTIYQDEISFTDTLITVYVWTQALTYGLRCHIHFINVGISRPDAAIFSVVQQGNTLHIRTPVPATACILDMSGRLLHEERVGESYSLDISGLAAGLYFIYLRDEKSVLSGRRFCKTN